MSELHLWSIKLILNEKHLMKNIFEVEEWGKNLRRKKNICCSW
jgi:hypothetical protein